MTFGTIMNTEILLLTRYKSRSLPAPALSLMINLLKKR